MHLPALLLQNENNVIVVILFCALQAYFTAPAPRFRFQNLFDFTNLSFPRGMTITRPDVAWSLKRKLKFSP